MKDFFEDLGKRLSETAEAVTAKAGDAIEIQKLKAENTNENIRYSYDLMESESKFAIVSTNYHLQRGLLIARKYNMDCIGIPATTDWRTAALGFINEIFKYIRRSPLIPAIVIASSLIIYMLQKW